MFQFLGRLFGVSKPEPKTYTVEINGVKVTCPVGVRMKYRRSGNARQTFQSRTVRGNAKAA
jgi:hypothetical protein